MAGWPCRTTLVRAVLVFDLVNSCLPADPEQWGCRCTFLRDVKIGRVFNSYFRPIFLCFACPPQVVRYDLSEEGALAERDTFRVSTFRRCCFLTSAAVHGPTCNLHTEVRERAGAATQSIACSAYPPYHLYDTEECPQVRKLRTVARWLCLVTLVRAEEVPCVEDRLCNTTSADAPFCAKSRCGVCSVLAFVSTFAPLLGPTLCVMAGHVEDGEGARDGSSETSEGLHSGPLGSVSQPPERQLQLRLLWAYIQNGYAVVTFFATF